MAPIPAVAHHHRSTTKTSQKPFKSRFASKGALKDQAKGKIENRSEDRGKRRTPHQQAMSKLARRNQARQLRIHHHEKKENESSIFQGREGAAKHVAVIPLSSNVDTRAAIQQLLESVDVTEIISEDAVTRVRVDRFRRNLLFMPTEMVLLDILDICRLADWVVLALSADQELGEAEDLLLRAVEGQGISNVIALAQGVAAVEPSLKRQKIPAQLKSDLNRYFPTLDKVSVLDNKADCANLVRSLCTATTRGIRWRDERSWMLVEDIEWIGEPDLSTPFSSEIVLTGVVRGRNLIPDRLVHVPGWGDFQVGRITEIPSQSHQRKNGEMITEEDPKQFIPTGDRDDLATLAPEEVDMVEATSTMATSEHKGVLLDDHHYFSDDNSHIPPPPKKLPKGTSSYQAAWYLEDVSESESDIMDEEPDDDLAMDTSEPLGPEDGLMVGVVGDGMTEAGPSEYPESEMHVDPSPDVEARDLEEYRASRKKEAEEDLDFPDEIELHPNVLARERLAKYRGLKSLRTSEWNTEEDAPYEPSDYQRLLKIADYKKSRSAATREALVGGVAPGTNVQVQLLDVPVSLKTAPRPSSLFSLLRHEHKHSVINLSMTLHSTLSEPIRAKEELVVQIGQRRFMINPIFSAAGTTPNDVHKFDRFLHPGRTAIATFTGPLTWGSVPVLVFQRRAAGAAAAAPSEEAAPPLIDTMNLPPALPSTNATAENPHNNLQLIGCATTLPPSHSRVIAKRVILTGHPYKINKKLVTVRYMFFNKEDVVWFAALPLWTRRGRQGFIKESLGTHGYFKATFDGKINPQDAVGVSLYKRVWPRAAKGWGWQT